MREFIERLGERGASGLAMSVAMLSPRETWTLKAADFSPEAIGLFASVLEKVPASPPDIGGIKGAQLLEQLAYAPPALRLPALVELARNWPEGLDKLLSGRPHDENAKLYRHNAVTSLVTLVAHAEQASLFHPDRIARVQKAVKKHNGKAE